MEKPRSMDKAQAGARTRFFILLAGTILLFAFLTACDNRTVDTRQYVNYIGVVFTNDASDIV